MKRRILSTLMALVLCLTLLPAAACAAGGTAVYVSSSGNDGTGDGSADKPRHAGQGGRRSRGRRDGLRHERPDHDGAARFRPVAIAKKIVILTKLTLAGKPALCYNFP